MLLDDLFNRLLIANSHKVIIVLHEMLFYVNRAHLVETLFTIEHKIECVRDSIFYVCFPTLIGYDKQPFILVFPGSKLITLGEKNWEGPIPFQ